MDSLGDARLLHTLNPREVAKLAAIAHERTFEPEEVIVALNVPVTSLYVVRDGRVRVLVPLDRKSEDDQLLEEVLVRIGPRECFGEFSYADRNPSSAVVVSEEKTTVWQLPHADLDAVLDADPPMALKLLRAMLATVVGRLRSTDAELVLARYVLRYV